MVGKKRSGRVYVIGAGFSGGLGYPMTNDLLIKIWHRLDSRFRGRLVRIIKFHHPEFDVGRRTSYPELEPLLSHMEANRQLFDHTRQVHGKFSPADVTQTTQELLWHVAQWFDEIHESVKTASHPWLELFRSRVVAEGSAIVSFNWDLVLDELLIGRVTDGKKYGFGKTTRGPVLLKPHGSLNWFDGQQAEKISHGKTVLLARNGDNTTCAFTELRAPRSKVGRRYNPLIIPPHYMKRFDQPGFQTIWQNCVSKLSTANEVVFLGYSLPPSDFHARFMLRCAFHNQVEGEISTNKKRRPATGLADVVVVNPDVVSAKRIEVASTPHKSFQWEPITIKEWIERDMGALDRNCPGAI